MLNAFRKFARKNLLLRKLVGYHLASSGLFDNYFRNYKVSPFWGARIDWVLKSTDNNFIPKVADAGKITSGKQVMHNGLKIHLGSYYGPEYSRMLVLTKGIHEPQEERVFMEVLKKMPQGALMIEMGSFWSFYSMWFQKEVRNAINYMIEPDLFNLGHGKRNFRLNKMKGNFINAFVGKETGSDKNGITICIDDFVKENSISFIHMLHSDIQGFEYEMLMGAEKTFLEKKIGYVFISTHSNELHSRCLEFLKKKDFIIIVSVNIDESFSKDGLIAARASYFDGINRIEISKRRLQ